jgi:seryl-tRNA synthetase
MSNEDLVAAHSEFRDRLFDAGLLLPTGVDGLYGRNSDFESVIAGIDRAVCRVGAGDRPIAVEYPPMIPKLTFDTIGYLRNFPQLCGPVFSFEGDNKDHKELLRQIDEGESYSSSLTQTDLALTPACCYPVYPSLSGELPPNGLVYEISSYCFRHEPSVDPMRLQAFRQREHIRIGTPEQVLDWRELWMQRAPELLTALGLTVRSDVANDPFFGRAGRLMSMSQREQQLKIEFLVPVFGEANPTACASINDHQEHFGHLFDIRTNGAEAHSSCIGFGLERCAVAMFAAHGLSIESWPHDIKEFLWT